MDRIESTIVVNAPPAVCYEKWHHFEQFPHFMNNVEEVEKIGNKVWHWVVNGPLGQRSEWDAIVDRDEPGQLIAWHSLSGSKLSISGVVSFKGLDADPMSGQLSEQTLEPTPQHTQITCEIEYEPNAGLLGEIITHLFMKPDQLLRDDLESFKHLVEGTNVPVEKVHVGRTLKPDPFVVPPASKNPITAQQEASLSTSSSRGTLGRKSADSTSETVSETTTPETDEEGYELIYGMEDDLPDLQDVISLRREDALEIQVLQEEESPYLGAAGALSNEDWIEIREEELGVASVTDVFAESMDVADDDLDSFREDLESEIDTGSMPGWIPLRSEASVQIEQVSAEGGEGENDLGSIGSTDMDRASRSAEAGLGPRESADLPETAEPALPRPSSEL